jgi:hypothetical protein
MKVYLAEYCSMTYEGAWEVIGVCQTKDLAYDLIERHRKYITLQDGKNLEWKRWIVKERDIIENKEQVLSVVEELK